MTPQARQALEYVRNTGGGATVGNFLDDHAPVGDRLWLELRFPVALIDYTTETGLVLTDAGRRALDEPEV
jgi:hypothetical protein